MKEKGRERERKERKKEGRKYRVQICEVTSPR
jgi:hypothetical protein